MFVPVAWNIAVEPSLVKGYAECCPQCTLNLNLDMAFYFVFVLSQIESIVHARQLFLNWSILRSSRKGLLC